MAAELLELELDTLDAVAAVDVAADIVAVAVAATVAVVAAVMVPAMSDHFVTMKTGTCVTVARAERHGPPHDQCVPNFRSPRNQHSVANRTFATRGCTSGHRCSSPAVHRQRRTHNIGCNRSDADSSQTLRDN